MWIREFLLESYVQRMNLSSCPEGMKEAVCYVADVPQQREKADTGLYVVEYIKRLMKGSTFVDCAPDVC